MRECVSLVAKGVISPAELDTCVKWGIGFKLAVIGPMELLDVAGLDIYEAVASYLNADLDDSARVSDYITFSAPARSRCRAIVVRAFQSGWDWSARPCCV
jgi:3-hydroxyacyl-CoA dehydrogenase